METRGSEVPMHLTIINKRKETRWFQGQCLARVEINFGPPYSDIEATKNGELNRNNRFVIATEAGDVTGVA
jgi:hypothetical protein